MTNESLAVQECAPALQEGDKAAALQAEVRGTNINEGTLLATDYLNHFNEIIMILELVADMPECLEEAQAWQPKSYEAHFEDSCFTDKELAIRAYRNAPPRFKKPFDNTIGLMNGLVEHGLGTIEAAVASGEGLRISEETEQLTRRLKRFIEVASGIIHGDKRTMDQAEIDQILNE